MPISPSVPSAPSAPSAASPVSTSTPSLLAPKSDIDQDAEQIKKEMEQERQKQKDNESKNMDGLLDQVANHLKTEQQEQILNVRQTKTLEKTMNGIHNSFDRLMDI